MKLPFEHLKPNRELAVLTAKRDLSMFVFDAVNLEGIPFTLPEIQTLLDGVTVGGHKLSDQNIALNQAKAWKFLFSSLENRTFELSKSFTCELHAIAGFEESLCWGAFRHSQVRISGTDWVPPAAKELDKKWDDLISEIACEKDIYRKAIHLFLGMARYQFFFDVNKRMGRFMMNGIILDAGLLAINVPVKRKQEFNTKMLDFYKNGHPSEMEGFLISCLDPILLKEFID